jgi:hypothetical protein
MTLVAWGGFVLGLARGTAYDVSLAPAVRVRSAMSHDVREREE